MTTPTYGIVVMIPWIWYKWAYFRSLLSGVMPRFQASLSPPPPCPAHRHSVCSHPPFTHLHISTSHGCPPPYYSCSCSSDGRLEYIGKLEIGDEAQVRESVYSESPPAAHRPPPAAHRPPLSASVSSAPSFTSGWGQVETTEDRQTTGRRQG
jgi:hypothetical protein